MVEIGLTDDGSLDVTNGENTLELIFVKHKHKLGAMTVHLLQCRYDGIIDADDFIFNFRYVVHIINSDWVDA